MSDEWNLTSRYTAPMPPRRPKTKKPSRFSSIPPGASFEDDVLLDELRRPWSLPVGEFLRVIRERYGVTYREEEIGAYRLAYLVTAAGVEVPLDDALEPEDTLTESSTRSLCVQLGIPEEDFYLAPEPPDA